MRVDKKNSTIVFDNLVQNPTSVGEKPQQTKIDINELVDASYIKKAIAGI
jgi:hypothetical protein